MKYPEIFVILMCLHNALMLLFRAHVVSEVYKAQWDL